MPDPTQPTDRSVPAGPPGLLEVGLLLAQFQQALQALTELMAALRTAAVRPPVHMDIASMAVQRLDFQLPAIDVESLSGELNVGITHKAQQPARSEAALAEPPRAEAAPSTRPSPAPTSQGAGQREAADASVRGAPPHALPHSPVSRWLAAGRPSPTQAAACPSAQAAACPSAQAAACPPTQAAACPPTQAAACPPTQAASPAVRSIWPPAERKGEPQP